MEIKVTKGDNFVWLLVTVDTAIELVRNENTQEFFVFALYEDDSEKLMESIDDVLRCKREGCKFGIEVESLDNILLKALAKWECPACGGKIEKSKMYATVWECTKCDEEYTLTDLLSR